LTSFSDLGLALPLLRALAAEGYEAPTPIQARAIPALLAGRDLKGIAQTGTGKTAAFALPILQRLAAGKDRLPRSPRALVLTPTRELAVQIADSFKAYGRYLPLKAAVIFGGVGQAPQVTQLVHGVDVLVATPGRLLDLLGQGHVRFDRLEVFVLDEADRMLDMGFINDVRKIVARLPAARQTLLFSATMPAAVRELAGGLLANPETVEVAPPATTVELIDQKVMFVEKADKRALLAGLLEDPAIERALVFTRTKHGASRLAEQLERAGHAADAIHGNKSQNARQRALEAFRAGRLRVLVATDIAARGIDVEGITHVVNFDLPNEPESYVHRIGRTARAGARGVAISFCDREERAFLADIEKTIRRRVPVEAGHAFHAAAVAGSPRQAPRAAAVRPAARPAATGAPAPRRGGWGRRRRAAA
jgi:ATP-dependent RNA helicase RhlE